MFVTLLLNGELLKNGLNPFLRPEKREHKDYSPVS
jgi:hypothetical protein